MNTRAAPQIQPRARGSCLPTVGAEAIGVHPDRPDLTALFQRLADATVRLVSERIELARYELREEIDRVLGLAARMLLGAAAGALGLVMIALAVTDLLRPLVHDAAARLLLVGAPLVGFGVARLARLARALPPFSGPPPPETDPDRPEPLDLEEIDD